MNERDAMIERAEVFDTDLDSENSHYEIMADFALAETAELRRQVEWIPVSERLPEDDDVYDVTFSPSYGQPFVKSVIFYHGAFQHEFDFEPIAWRERPEPYKDTNG